MVEATPPDTAEAAVEHALTWHEPKGSSKQTAHRIIMCCAPLADEQATQLLTTFLRDRLVSGGFAVALIELAEGEALDHVSHAAVNACRGDEQQAHDERPVSLIGIGAGTIALAASARRLENVGSIVLVSPLAPAALNRALKRLAKDDDASPPTWSRNATTIDAMRNAPACRDMAFHDRPTLLITGAGDRLTGPAHAAHYQDTIDRAGHHAESLLIATADHVFSEVDCRDTMADHVHRFIKDRVKRAPAAATTRAASASTNA